MKTLTREDIKNIFKKVKKLRIPKDLLSIDFEKMKYFAWLEPSSQEVFMIYEYNGKQEGIKWDTTKASKSSTKMAFCEICKKHRSKNEILLITAKTKNKPKGVNSQTRGNFICSDFATCNESMDDLDGINSLYDLIFK
ncbi:FBP domain-containing protein [Candidatus Dojkabacteria bacterium]|nr:FBP domain-containing protein [Candidatus Dojkabacteria bacterium]